MTEVYSKATLLWNGTIMAEESNVTIRRMSQGKPVFTQAKGFAGISPGAKYMTVSIRNAVPRDGNLGVDVDTAIDSLIPGELTCIVGNRRLVSRGFILEDSLTAGVDAASEVSFEFTGEFAQFQPIAFGA